MEDSIKDSNDKVSSPMGVNDHPSVDFQIKQARTFHNRISELGTMCEKDGKILNWYPIALRAGDKKPAGLQSWTEREVSALSWEEVESHIRRNRGNYGMVAVDNLESSNENEITIVFVDYDVDENGRFKMPSPKVNENLRRFDTLTTKTRSGGYHQICAINLLEKRKFYKKHGRRNFNIMYKGASCGEVRLNNQYVVAPGSYVPVTDEKQRDGYQGMTATGYYEIEIDKPIRFISADDLELLLYNGNSFPQVGTSRGTDRVSTADLRLVNELDPDTIASAYGLTVEEVRAKVPELDNLLAGAGASPTSKNPDKKVDRSRLDMKTAHLLKKHGFTIEQTWVILREYRPYKKTLSDNYLDSTLSKVYKDEGSFTSLPTITATMGDPSDTETEEVVLPQFPDKLSTIRPCTHLLGLPRTGKSYFAQKLLGTAYGSGVYVAPSHEILKQQYARFKQQFPNKTCVRLVGKGQEGVCTYANSQGKRYDCVHCPKAPRFDTKSDDSSNPHDDIVTWWEMERVAKKIVVRYKHVDPSTFAQEEFHTLFESEGKEFCPYYSLHFCEREVDYVFTTPYYTTVPADSGSITSIKKREVCVIDEDPSFRFYSPQDVALVEYGSYPTITTVKNHLIEYAVTIGHLKSAVMSVYEKDETGKEVQKEKQRLKDHERVIIGLINYFETVLSRISQFKDGYAAMEFEELVYAIEETRISPRDKMEFALYHDNEMKQKVLKEIDRYERMQRPESGLSLRPLFETLLYPLMPSSYCIMGKNPKTLYLVGDKEKIVREPQCADEYILIGFSEADQFAKRLFPSPTDRIRYRIDSFPYKQNFTLVAVCGEDTKRQQALTKSFIRKMVEKNRSSAWKVPSMVLTSSQKQQETLAKGLPDGTSYTCRKDEINTYLQKWCEGDAEIFYQNSTISRGIDIPWMDVLIVYGCNFAQPYPRAVLDYCENALECVQDDIRQERARLKSLDPSEPGYNNHVEEIQARINELRALYSDMKEQMDEKICRAKMFQHSRLVDETTNSVLRPTPVNGKRVEQAKFIVIPEKDRMFLNPEFVRDVRTIDIRSEADINAVIDLICESVTKVNSEAIMLKGTGHALTEITDYTDEDIERANEIDGIQFGKSYHEVAPLIEELRAELDSPDGQPLHARKFDIVGLVEEMVKHPAFSKWKKGNQCTVSISMDSLINWVRSRKKKLYSVHLYRQAVAFMVKHNWVSVKRSDLMREHSTLERDNARHDDKLYMTKENVSVIHEDTMGKIIINPKSSN